LGGTGGMFGAIPVKFIESHQRNKQKKFQFTGRKHQQPNKLAQMNLAIRRISQTWATKPR